MNNKERIAKLKPEGYQGILGVKQDTFKKMLEVLEQKHSEKKKRGAPGKITVLDRLVMALDYWHDYRPFRRLAFDYGVSKSLVQAYVVWVEDVLIKSGEFALPSKRVLTEANDIEVIMVDVTEQEIERPKKNSVNGIQARKRNTR